MSNVEEFALTKKQKLTGNIAAGAVTVLCGIFLLLCGVNVIKIAVSAVFLASILATIGFVFLVTGIIQKNTVSIWIAIAFLTPALVDILAKFTHLTYGALYPVYIAIPAICSLFTALYSRAWRSHYQVITLFGLIAAIFSIQSSGLAGWAVVLPCFVVFVGLCILFFALSLRDSKQE